MAKLKPHAIVIGAGLAGLAAANHLVKNNWRVTVLEGQPRYGGRVLSKRFNQAQGLVCELGGEWIGADHRRMKRLCREFHLGKLKPHMYSARFWEPHAKKRGRRFPPGQGPFSKAAKRGFATLEKQFKERHKNIEAMKELDQSDWWTTLAHNGFTVDDLVHRELMDSTDFGESIRLSSAYLAATEYFDSNTTDEMDFKIKDGNDRLPDALVKRISRHGDVWLQAPVRRVEQDVRGVNVFIDGRNAPFHGQFCICTVPAHCLRLIKWKPALPKHQVDAAKQLQYSRIMKTAVLYATRFWEAGRRQTSTGFAVFSSRASDFCFDSTFGQEGTMGILCSYAIGDKADDLAAETNPNHLMKWITEDVVQIANPPESTVVAPIDIDHKAWQREPGVGGAYAFYRPGQWFSIRPLLQEPHQRVFFAGEHLSAEWQGFMEGAVETGEHAARRIIAVA